MNLAIRLKEYVGSSDPLVLTRIIVGAAVQDLQASRTRTEMSGVRNMLAYFHLFRRARSLASLGPFAPAADRIREAFREAQRAVLPEIECEMLCARIAVTFARLRAKRPVEPHDLVLAERFTVAFLEALRR